MNINPGDICRTNLSQPGGLVKIICIEPSEFNPGRLAAFIEHVEDHPYGYKKGEKGWYMADELVLVAPRNRTYQFENVTIVHICDNCGHAVGKLYFDECWGSNNRNEREFDMQWICATCKSYFDGTAFEDGD